MTRVIRGSGGFGMALPDPCTYTIDWLCDNME